MNSRSEFTPITAKNVSVPSNFIFEADIQCNNVEGFGILAANNKYLNVNMYPKNGQVLIFDYNTFTSIYQAVNVVSNIWYHIILKVENNVMTATIKNGDATVFNYSFTLPSTYQNGVTPYVSAYYSDTQTLFANMKIKPL